MTVTDEQMQEWEKLAAAATPGPWVDDAEENVVFVVGGAIEVADIYAGERAGANAAFIASAREAVPALVTEVRRLRAVNLAHGEQHMPLVKMASELEQERDQWKARAEAVEAERDVLRGVDCMVDGDGPCGCCVKCLRARAEQAERERDDLLVWAVELKGDAMAKSDPVERAMVHFYKTDAGLLRTRLAEVERERDTLAEGCKRLAAQCAEMREVIRDLRIMAAFEARAHVFNAPPPTDAQRQQLSRRADAAIAPDAGKGWVSPEKHAEVEAQCAVMREAIRSWNETMANVDPSSRYPGCDPGCEAPDEPGHHVGECVALKFGAALDPGAGRALLDEVEALGEVAELLREGIGKSPRPSYEDYEKAVLAAIAKLDALKAGGR